MEKHAGTGKKEGLKPGFKPGTIFLLRNNSANSYAVHAWTVGSTSLIRMDPKLMTVIISKI